MLTNSVVIAEPAVCTVFGDPHYRTFDGLLYNFQGPCTYLLAQDCTTRNFSVRVRNAARLTNNFAWTKAITVLIGSHRISLRQRLRVQVDRETVTLPYTLQDVVYLQRKPGSLLLEATSGLQIIWDGDSYLEVTVPLAYKSHMCGLCGNYNGFDNDDLLGKDGALYLDPHSFGHTWQLGKTFCWSFSFFCCQCVELP